MSQFAKFKSFRKSIIITGSFDLIDKKNSFSFAFYLQTAASLEASGYFPLVEITIINSHLVCDTLM